MIYLASPYSSPSHEVREERFKAVARADLFLNSQGVQSFSPIAHWHVVALENTLPTDASTWSDINKRWVSKASKIAVLCLPGWEQSEGIILELHWAKELDIPVVYLDPELHEKWVHLLTEESEGAKLCH